MTATNLNLMASEIAEIRSYTKLHPELSTCHHFQYDLPLAATPDLQNSGDKRTCLMLGINPGESAPDTTVAWPTEETSEFDFHDQLVGRESIRWTQKVRKILPTMRVWQSQLFFWSSKDRDQLKDRLGSDIERSPHLAWCTDRNLALIQKRQPDIVILAGMTKRETASRLFHLEVMGEPIFLRNGKDRLVVKLTDGHRPWLVIAHLTSAHPPLNEDEEAQVRLAIDELVPLPTN